MDLPKRLQMTYKFFYNEILMTSGTDNQSVIEKETLMGEADVEERCGNLEQCNMLGWN